MNENNPIQRQQTILIVDDLPENLTILSESLLPHYQVRVATSGQKALRLARTLPYPDLILLDVVMPDIDGYQVFEQLRKDPISKDIPVIFVTAMTGVDAELQGLDLGAVDYLTKPIVPSIVLSRVHNQLELKSARDILANQNAWLEDEIKRRMAENELIQEVSIRALASLAETRDMETGHHILRTQKYVNNIANGLQNHPNFSGILTDCYITLLTRSAPLHDIGKVGIPDAILRKPGSLSPDEWQIMKTHTVLGSEAISIAEKDTTEPLEFLSLAKEITRWHHEKWDGSGYPDGLVGTATPVSARIMALADVFDALISPRTYKKAMPYEQAKILIESGRGKHFDPDITDYFLNNFRDFYDIAEAYLDAAKT